MTQQNNSGGRGLIIIATIVLAVIPALISAIAAVEENIDLSGIIPVLLAVVVAVIAVVLWMVARTTSVAKLRPLMHDAFTAMGFQSAAGTQMSTQYRGEISALPVVVTLRPGPLFEIDVSARILQVARIGPEGEFAIFPEDSRMAHVMMDAVDPAWGRRLVEDDNAREALVGLLGDADQVKGRSVHLKPGSVQARIMPQTKSEITAGALRQWANETAALAKAAALIAPEPEAGDPEPAAPSQAALPGASPQRSAVVIAVAIAVLVLGLGMALVLFAGG